MRMSSFTMMLFASRKSIEELSDYGKMDISDIFEQAELYKYIENNRRVVVQF